MPRLKGSMLVSTYVHVCKITSWILGAVRGVGSRVGCRKREKLSE